LFHKLPIFISIKPRVGSSISDEHDSILNAFPHDVVNEKECFITWAEVLSTVRHPPLFHCNRNPQALPIGVAATRIAESLPKHASVPYLNIDRQLKKKEF
jgi:hypothetical protein